MKIEVLQENLQKGLSAAQRAISPRPQTPVLANVLLEPEEGGIRISATDLELGIRVFVGGKVEGKEKVVISGRLLGEFVSSLNAGKVVIEILDGKVKLSSGQFKASFQASPADEFPPFPEKGSLSRVFSVDGEGLTKALSRVLHAAAKDSMRPVLTGVLFEFSSKAVTLAATDGFRLAVDTVVDLAGEVPLKNIVVPARVLNEVMRQDLSGGVEIGLIEDSNQIVFVSGDTILVSQILDGNFPEYRKIIPPKFTTEAVVEREELMQAVAVSQVFAKENSNVVKWEVLKSTVKLAADSPEQGNSESEIAAKVEGEGVEIAFNGRFVQDFLQAVSSERVRIGLNDRLAPGVFQSEGDDKFMAVVMPINL